MHIHKEICISHTATGCDSHAEALRPLEDSNSSGFVFRACSGKQRPSDRSSFSLEPSEIPNKQSRNRDTIHLDIFSMCGYRSTSTSIWMYRCIYTNVYMEANVQVYGETCSRVTHEQPTGHGPCATPTRNAGRSDGDSTGVGTVAREVAWRSTRPRHCILGIWICTRGYTDFAPLFSFFG